MSDTTTLRDHSQPCEHEDEGALIGAYEQDGIWFCGMGCPGGRERTFEQVYGSPVGRRTHYDFYEDEPVWVEVSDVE